MDFDPTLNVFTLSVLLKEAKQISVLMGNLQNWYKK